jgi:hypothetical protein
MALCRALFILGCLGFAAFPQAQSTSGDVKGTVVDPSGSAISKAKLTISDPDRGISRTADSGSNGEFNLPLLPPARYKLKVDADGFTTKIVDGVEVRVGDTLSLTVQMSISGVVTEVDVQAVAPAVDTERYQQANTIDLTRIKDLPINRRNYLDFALLAPATAETSSVVDGTDYRPAQTPQSGISFGGGNGRGNGFSIDGVENYINSGGVRLSVSQEAVQEFQINRNTASTEFGWASGGTINIITKSGTNAYHGNAFGFIRQRAIQARNYFDPEKSAFTRVQAGGTLGGPIVKDRTFFFAAYERLNREETAFVPILSDKTPFTTLTASQQELVNFFTVSGVPALQGLAVAMKAALTPSNNPFVTNMFTKNSGTFPFSEGVNLFSVKLDHRISERQNIYFRGNLSTNDTQNSQFGALIGYNRGRSFNQWDGTGMIDHSLLIGNNLVVETRFMFNYNNFKVNTIDPYGPELNVAGYGFFDREIFLPSYNWERHYQIMQNWNLHKGKHDLKWGFDINPVRNNVYSATFFSGRFNFGEAVPLGQVINSATGNPNGAADIAALLVQLGQARLVPNLALPISALQSFSLGLPTFYQQGFGNPNWIGWTKRNGFYFQDAFKISPKFTLNVGVRYDLEINEPVLGPVDKNNFFPRAGFAWMPTGSGNTVIRGGYGFYIMPTNLQIANVADTLSGKYINQVFVPLTGVPGINNPQTGRPTTSADIYQGLFKQGIIGTRSITEADIAPYGVRVGPGLPLAVVFGSDPVRNGYAQQASLEIEHSFGGYVLSLGYNYNRSLGIARISGRNVYYTGQTTALGIPVYGRYNPLVLQNNIFTYDGNSSYNAGYVQIAKRLLKNFSINAHYTWSKALDDVTDFNSDFSPMDQLNKRGEWSLSPFHHAHRVVATAILQSTAKNPFLAGWNFAPIFQANSWRPFNVLAGVDVNGDNYTTNDRPYGLGRDVGQGPAYWSFDSRLSRIFVLRADGKMTLQFIAEGFNLFNHTNFKTINNTVGPVPLGALPNPIRGIAGAAPVSPLSYTSAFDPRQFQFGLKLSF